jgi:EpsI family protein
MSPHRFRMAFIALLMTITGFATASLRPAHFRPSPPPDLEAMMPDHFAGWRRIALSQAVLPPETELQPGEAVAYRAYQDDLGRIVTLVAAFGPPLGDSVRLHRPEKCYTAQGFEIRARSQSRLVIDGRDVPLINLDTLSPARREAVTYWLRDGAGFTTKASDNGLQRLRKGVSRPLDGALVRISTINGEAPQFDLHQRFLADFSKALSPRAATVLLGVEAPS